MPAETEAQRGAALLQSKGCLACHSVDGTARTGPTFRELWGRTRPVVSREGVVNVVVDEAYVARSMREPDAEVGVGFNRGSMPRFDVSDADAHAIALAMQDPAALAQAPGARGGSIVPLASASIAFVLLHFVLSSVPVRTQVIAALKAKGFAAVYSLLALGSFVAMIVFYRSAPLALLWSPPRWTRWVPVLVMPLAILFLTAGFSTPSPTAVGQEKAAKERPRGIQAVTRHPALWGFSLWGLAHLATNGELHVVIVCAANLVLALGGMLHIDARRKATLGADWDAYAARTSLLPFAAIAGGRARLVPAEIGARRVAIAAAIYIVLFFVHPYVIGASPVP